jgi:hypothetical protein
LPIPPLPPPTGIIFIDDAIKIYLFDCFLQCKFFC